MLKQYQLKNYHFQLILYLAILTIIGILVVGSAEKSVQNKQILGFVLGLVIMIAISLMDYSFILRFSWIIYLGTIVLLLLVELIGEKTGGAQRWIDIGFRFQPSEIAKIGIILFFAYFFMKYEEKLNTVKSLALAIVLIGIPLFLIYKQPDLSTTIVTAFIFIVLLFIAGLSYKIILSVIGVCVPVGIIAITYIMRKAEQIATGAENGYQMGRIMSWLDPTNPKWSDKAAQQQNSIMAIGSGQLWGKGLNNSQVTSMKNTNYIIEPQTDFIFAVVGEELGFVGTLTVIVLLFLIVIECILIGRKAKDLSGRLICCGVAALVSFQSFVNICVTTGLMPNTGIPLPFVSYGLTSLISLYIGMGFVLNVALQPKKYVRGVYL